MKRCDVLLFQYMASTPMDKVWRQSQSSPAQRERFDTFFWHLQAEVTTAGGWEPYEEEKSVLIHFVWSSVFCFKSPEATCITSRSYNDVRDSMSLSESRDST